MKVLCSADIHLNDWSAYSTLDQYGRQSRLLDYLKLAETMITLAKSTNCKAIILAGDISEKALQKPHVLDVMGDFLRKLGSALPVHIIHGQHDLSVKEHSISHKNSILTEICKDLSDYNIHYYPEPTTVDIGGYSFLFQSWQQDHKLPEDSADVYVGHGMVKGCTNLDGYIFINGFDEDELLDKYRLSIIGDVHNKQTFYNQNESRVVLQPGAPIQNTWKDANDCGIWVADVEHNFVDLEFHNIHDLSPNTFHQFVYDQENTDLIHSRPRVKLKDKKKKAKKVEVKRDVTLIRDTCFELTKDQPKLAPLIEEVFENTQLSADKVVAKTVIKSVSAKNFLSIDEFSLDFNEFPHACAIVGHNGSGKSTLSEAIYWCLTGNTTKDIPISGIVNQFKDTENCTVTLFLEINDQPFTISRERKGKTGHLVILDKDENPFRRGSMRETQEEIYNMLGLRDWQIQMFSYFSAEKTSLFSDLGDSAKNDLISQVVGLDFVEKMRVYSKERRLEARDKTLKMKGGIEEKEAVVKSNRRKLAKLEEESASTKPQLEAMISKKKNTISSIKEAMTEVTGRAKAIITETGMKGKAEIRDYIKSGTESYYKVQGQADNIARNKKLLRQDIGDLEAKLEEAEKGTCPTCGQHLHNPSIADGYKKSVSEKASELDDLPDENALALEASNNFTKIKGLEKLKDELEKCERDYGACKADLKVARSEVERLEEDLDKSEENPLINHLKSEIEKIENELDDLDKEFNKLSKNEGMWKFLEANLFKRSGDLAKELNKQGSKLIQACIDEIAEGAGISFKISPDLKLSAKFHNGKEMGYTSMSSGQRRLTDIIMMVSLNNLFSKIYNLEEGVLGLAIYDEILSFLDEKYIQVAKHFVDQSLSRKVLIITHDYGLMSLYDSRINVEMSKTGSEYKRSWL